MGHYHHMHVTFVFEGLPKDIVEMLDLQEKWLMHDRYYKQTEEETTRRRKECYEEVDKFAKSAKNEVNDFIKKHPLEWDEFFLYEAKVFEWIHQGTDYPWGWESSGIHALHAKYDANYNSMRAFKDFVELVRPYIKSGSAWGWWESDASSFEVFY